MEDSAAVVHDSGKTAAPAAVGKGARGDRGIPGRYMPRVRALRIHAFHDAAFWLSVSCSVATFPLVWVASGDPVLALGGAAAALLFAALIACTVVDLMSMRIPDRVSLLPVWGALMWWAALALGMPDPEGPGFARAIYSLSLVDSQVGAIVPELWTGALWKDILMSVAAAVLVFVPLLGSFVLGAMGGGDVKFMPPFALFLGWSLAFDFLFLTFLFGGLFAGMVIVARKVVHLYVARVPGRHPEWERFSRMRFFAYAPAIAAAGLVCLAAKWEGFF